MEWKEYRINDLFNIKSGKDTNLDNSNVGTIPFVNSSGVNNGITAYVKKCSVKISNCITIARTGSVGSCFYQQGLVGISGNIRALTPKDFILNKYNANFIIMALRKNIIGNYNYGKILGSERIARLKILLPATSSGEPDFKYMEQYIKEMKQKKILDYIAYASKRLGEMEYKIVPELKDKKWKEFCIGDIYDIKSGCSLTKENMINGNTPFIGASANNNAVTNFVSNTNRSLDKNVVNINFNGSVGEAFYHPYTALFSGDVKRLHLKDYPDNEYINLFIITSIKSQKDKYSYGYKFSEKRMIRQYIKLPVNDAGDPDYEYMEQYIKNMEYDKIIEYMAYIA